MENKEKTFTGLDFNLELVLVYLVPLLGLIFSFMDQSKYSERCKFAYNQSGTIFICYAVLTILTPFTFGLASLAIIALFVFGIIALIKGCNGEDYKIPLVEKVTDMIFNKEKKEEK